MNDFEGFGLSQELKQAIQELGITTPTEIQEQSIPAVIKGKDVVGESATGSGKTLAFGCAIVDHLDKGKGIQSLILTPTRELCEQVKSNLVQLSRHKGLKVISIYGGVSYEPQLKGLHSADVVVATPGRLLDHLQQKNINLSKVSILIMDEADRMFDMGFIDDVEKIIRQCPKERQTLFFSATISTRVRELAGRHMKEWVEVRANNQVDPSLLTQMYYDVARGLKLSLLVHLLKKEQTGLVMVFCNTRHTTDFVVKNLKANGISAIAIHGGLSQNRRTKTITDFGGAKAQILVATDVAARGLHIENVSHVYNYEIPSDPKDYVHRIGRTARAGEEGKIVNLVADVDHDNFGRLIYEYREFKVPKSATPNVPRIVALREERQDRGRFGRGSQRSGPRHGPPSIDGSRNRSPRGHPPSHHRRGPPRRR
ncbi:MAG: DEAD/DEAH box helicase [Nanoarchaeota archaeon]